MTTETITWNNAKGRHDIKTMVTEHIQNCIATVKAEIANGAQDKAKILAALEAEIATRSETA